MQANTTSPRLRVSDVASWIVAIFGVVLLVLLLLSFALETRAPATPAASTTLSGPRVAYFEFGPEADTLWLVSTANPSRREAVLQAPHAFEFGVVPSISPDGEGLVYTALAQETAAPTPDSPAGLYYTSLDAGTQPRLIAGDIDLLVPPVWSLDGSRVVFRRSDTTSYSLIETPVDGGPERTLVMTTSDHALFPVGFSADDETLYYVMLSNAGSRLYAVDVEHRTLTDVATLADGLTRDWALSPDASHMAFLALEYTPQAINSRAYLVDLASGDTKPVTDAGVSAFGPVWDADGALMVGVLTPDGEGSFVRLAGGQSSLVRGPDSGFDVPLAYLPGGAHLVRAFEGASPSAPGRASLTLIDSNDERHVLSNGDVTFVGWSAP
jgi:hypothetical protein